MKKLIQNLLLVLALVVGLTAVLPTTAQAQCRPPVRVVRVSHQYVPVYRYVIERAPCGTLVVKTVLAGYQLQTVYSY